MQYRDQIRENVLIKQYYCDVNFDHLLLASDQIATKLRREPAETIPLVCYTDRIRLISG